MTTTNDICTDPDNCKRCKTHPNHREGMSHAGIPMSGEASVPAPVAERSMSALAHQEGGGHYKKLPIQPVEYIHANGIGYFEGNVIKYVTRWRSKNGKADLLKAKHYIELLIELEAKQAGAARGSQA